MTVAGRPQAAQQATHEGADASLHTRVTELASGAHVIAFDNHA